MNESLTIRDAERYVDTRVGECTIIREVLFRDELLAYILCARLPLQRYMLVPKNQDLHQVNFSLKTSGDLEVVIDFANEVFAKHLSGNQLMDAADTEEAKPEAGRLDVSARLDDYLAVDERINAICDRFEEEWRTGIPEIQKYLQLVEKQHRASLLAELLPIDKECRRNAGLAITREQYEEQLPAHGKKIAEFFASVTPPEIEATLPVNPAGIVDGITSTIPPLATGVTDQSIQAGDTVRYFGDYQLLEEIARGGMGVVYKAKQVSLNRVVALKMILAGHLAGEQDVKRFQAEAEAAANLDHPNIVPVFEVGQHNGQHYFSMGYVEGESLAGRIAAGPLDPKEAVAIVKVVSEGIAYAHAQGVIHRDLKPANILLSNDSSSEQQVPSSATRAFSASHPTYTPKVADFGLAKRLGEDQGMTATGQILGTPAYMPPEQAGGKIDEISERADVYSLGAILYCLLTGRPPFQASNQIETLQQVLSVSPVSPTQINPAIPRDLATICLKCLEKQANKRYRSAEELAQELGRYQRGEPITARAVGPAERGWRWCKRNPVIASLTAGIALVLLLGTIVSASFAFVAHQTIGELQTTLERANREEFQNRVASVRLYAVQIAAAQNEWQAGNWDRARERLENCQPSLRGWEYYHLVTKFNQQTGINCVAFSPDRRLVASGSADSTIKLWRINNRDEALTLSGHSGSVNCVSFSPDSRRIVTGSDDRSLKIWDTGTGQEILTLTGHTDSVQSVAFSPDGLRIVSGSADDTARLWDAKTGQAIFTCKGHATAVSRVIFSSDGRQILSGTNGHVVKVWSVETGREVHTREGPAEGPSAGLMSAAFSADGKYVAGRNRHMLLVVWDVETGEKFFAPRGYTRGIIAFSPDGKKLVTSDSRDNSLQVWDIRTGQEVLSLSGHQRPISCVAFSSDGKRIVSGAEDNTVKVWDAETALETRALKHDRQVKAIGGLAFSPDGRKIATGSDKNTLTILDAETSEELLTLNGHTAAVTSMAFSPDGRRIVSGAWDKTARVWNAETGQETLTLRRASTIDFVDFSRDGRRIVTAVFKKHNVEFTIWDAGSGVKTRDLILQGHKKSVECLAISPDGRQIVSGSADDTLKVWNAETGQEIRTLKGHNHIVFCLAFSRDGQRIASSSADGAVKVWDTNSGREIVTIKADMKLVDSIAVGPFGRRVVSGDTNGAVKVWDVDTGQQTGALENRSLHPVRGVAFSACGKHIARLSLDKTLKIWHSEMGAGARTFNGHIGPVNSVAFSPDGRRIVSGSADTTLKLWDARTALEILTFKGKHAHWVSSVAFDSDGHRVVSGSWDNTITLWNADTGQELLTFTGHTGRINAVAFSPDDKWIVSGSDDKTVRVWNARTGQQSFKVAAHTDSVYAVAFSPDGRRIVSAGESDQHEEIKVWDAVARTELLKLPGSYGAIRCVAFGPEGKRIVSGGSSLKVWDTETAKELLTLKGHRASSVAFSPDGKRIVSGSEDMSLKVWNAATGQEIVTLDGHQDKVWSVAFSPDGQRIVSGSEDGSIKVWGAAITGD